MHNMHHPHTNPVDSFQLLKRYERQSRGELLKEGQGLDAEDVRVRPSHQEEVSCSR